MIDQGIVNLLATSAGVQAAVAASANVAALVAQGQTAAQATPAAIYQGVAPADITQYPCLSYQFAGGSSAPTQTSSGLQKARLQMDCWGAGPGAAEAAKTLAGAVISALNGYVGTLSDGTRASILLFTPGIDFFSGDSRFFRRMIEFYVMYTFTS